MANIPTPRSYSQILGGMINTFLSRLGLPSIKAGDPSLSIMEAASQSDFRSTQDIFQNINSQFLDSATGVALSRIGESRRVFRLAPRASSGTVTIGDNSFSKIETRIYQGGVGVTAGSTTLSIESEIPANGSLYLGRGSANAEGPLAYTTVVASGPFWIVTLSTSTSLYHQTGEKVTYSQGGDRLVAAGTVVSTPATSAGQVVTFSTLYDATLLAGENSLANIPVQAQLSGVGGNVGVGAISSFATSPFVGATVTNTLAFTNGSDVESEQTYKERIKLARKSEAKATADAITYAAVGARSLDESGSVVSVSTSFRAGEPRTLYIDDGTGYQEKDEGVVLETILSPASGGERFFSLTNRPVAKAYLKTGLTAPFTLVENSTLTLSVGGVESTHTFSASSVRDVNNASAYEIASAINANGTLLFGARISDSASKVAFYAKEESNEDIELISGSTANDWLDLPSGRVYTLYLYKNDELLFEDGKDATVYSKLQLDWGFVTTGQTIELLVDGIPVTATITNQDFIAANTAYTTVSASNSLNSWAAVLNYKIPGITASVAGGKIAITSNRGKSNLASVSIIGGLLGAGLFSLPVAAVGLTSDYSFDRNSGHIKLAQPLLAGDVLVAGSSNTNGHLSAEIGTLVLGSQADLWFTVDGDASYPRPSYPLTNIAAGSTLTWSVATSPSWGNRFDIAGVTGTWTNVEEGDWLVVTDSNVAADNRGVFKVATKTSPTTIQIERPAASASTGAVTLAEGGFTVVRSSVAPFLVSVPAGTYSATTLAAVFAATSLPVRTQVYGTSLRLSTASSSGSISLVSTNVAGAAIAFPTRTVSSSALAHFAYSQSAAETSTFSPSIETVSAVTSTTRVTLPSTSPRPWLQMLFLKSLPDGLNLNRWSNDTVRRTIQSSPTAFEAIFTEAAPKEFLVGNRVMLGNGFEVTPRDNLQLLLDNDTVSGRYNVDMYRKVKIASTAGGYEVTELDGSSLAQKFGQNFNWVGYELAAKPRNKTHSNPDTTKTVLYRWWRHDRQGGRIQYRYAVTPNAPISVESDQYPADVGIRLASGAARSVPTIRASSRIGVAVTALAANLYTYQFVANLAVASANRVIRIGYTGRNATAFAGTVTGTISGATATVSSDSQAGGSPAAVGFLTVTGVTGTFIANEGLTAGAATATSSSGTYGYTTLTLTLPGATTDHGLAVGTTIYTTVAAAGFVAGARVIAAATSSTISYIDTVATTASAGAGGTVSNDVAGEVTLNGTSVATGDIFSAGLAPFDLERAFKIVRVGDGNWTAVHYRAPGVAGTLGWQTGGGSFYPLNAAVNTAAGIAAGVNAVSNSPISAVGVGSGGVSTGVVDAASYETTELGGTNPWYGLGNGSDWIQSHNTPATPSSNFVLVTRNSLVAWLASNADLANEDIRLVPRTAKTIAGWLNSTAVSGLANRGAAFETRMGSVQVQSSTLGGASSARITAGSASSAGTSVLGAASAVSYLLGMSSTDAGLIPVTASSAGFNTAAYVWAQNAISNDKAVFTSATTLVSIASDGNVEVGVTNAWTRRNTLVDNVPLIVEKLGNFLLLTPISTQIGTGNPLSLTSVLPGDWINILPATATYSGTSTLAGSNTGFFRVVSTAGGGAVLVEAPSGLEQYTTAKIDFLAYNSILPGDVVSFNSSLWGTANIGRRTVLSLGTTQGQFVLDTSEAALAAQGPVAALGAQSGLFRVTDRVPYASLLNLAAVTPVSANETQLLVYGTDVTYINEAFGTSIVALNKLAFPDGLEGRDSYKKNTGLIAEVSKIVFGDESSLAPSGVASAGASYNINGPVVKRITVALAIRPLTGVSIDEIKTSVQSSVSAAVNATAIGEDVAISEIVSAAQSVNGVVAVSVLSPLYSASSDMIPVQAYEKALVLDPKVDVTVSIVGA